MAGKWQIYTYFFAVQELCNAIDGIPYVGYTSYSNALDGFIKHCFFHLQTHQQLPSCLRIMLHLFNPHRRLISQVISPNLSIIRLPTTFSN